MPVLLYECDALTLALRDHCAENCWVRQKGTNTRKNKFLNSSCTPILQKISYYTDYQIKEGDKIKVYKFLVGSKTPLKRRNHKQDIIKTDLENTCPGYTQVCARWVPKMRTFEHKTARKNICAELLQCSERDGEALCQE